MSSSSSTMANDDGNSGKYFNDIIRVFHQIPSHCAWLATVNKLSLSPSLYIYNSIWMWFDLVRFDGESCFDWLVQLFAMRVGGISTADKQIVRIGIHQNFSMKEWHEGSLINGFSRISSFPGRNHLLIGKHSTVHGFIVIPSSLVDLFRCIRKL